MAAERERHDQEALVQDTENRIAASRAQGDLDAHDLLRRHAFALRMEMTRRKQTEVLDDRARAAMWRMERWKSAKQAERIVDLVAENREAEGAAALRQTEQRSLDEAGLQGWLRRRAGEVG
jgi:hypothetical protein